MRPSGPEYRQNAFHPKNDDHYEVRIAHPVKRAGVDNYVTQREAANGGNSKNEPNVDAASELPKRNSGKNQESVREQHFDARK